MAGMFDLDLGDPFGELFGDSRQTKKRKSQRTDDSGAIGLAKEAVRGTVAVTTLGIFAGMSADIFRSLTD